MVKLYSIKEERLERLVVRKFFESKYNDELISVLKNNIKSEDAKILEETIEFIHGIDFNHPGLSSEEYINHPLRMTVLVSQFNNDIEFIKLALLHNVLEVSDIKEEELSQFCTEDTITALKVLKVDRTQDRDWDYKENYYKNITSLSNEVGIIKAMDKFDNLFLLCLNPSDKVREFYLKEIERFVIPIVEKNLSFIVEYYKNLISDCKEFGFLDKEKSQLEFGKDYS